MTDIDVDSLAGQLFDYAQLNQDLNPADAIIAMGNMDIRLATRAAELYKTGLSPVIVAAGGIGRLTPKAWHTSEAVHFAEELYRCGVPEGKVIVEANSTNIVENIQFAVDSLNKAGLRSQRLILVSLPFAERRIMRLCQKQFSSVEIQVTSPKIRYQDYANDAVSKVELLNLIAGELDRLDKFPAKGFSVPEEVPESIRTATRSLIDAGYDKYKVA